MIRERQSLTSPTLTMKTTRDWLHPTGDVAQDHRGEHGLGPTVGGGDGEGASVSGDTPPLHPATAETCPGVRAPEHHSLRVPTSCLREAYEGLLIVLTEFSITFKLNCLNNKTSKGVPESKLQL